MRRTGLIAVLVIAIAVVAGVATAASSLIDAVKSGDQAAIRTLLRQGVDVNASAADGATALHWAATNDDAATIALLLRSGAKVNAVNRYGLTAMTIAAQHGNAEIAEALLKAGADPNATLPEGETILMTAARSGNAQIVKSLLARGAKANTTESWQDNTALMLAAAENHADVVKALVEGGADMNLKAKVLEGMPPRNRSAPDVGQQGVHSTFPKGGMTALHYAARQNAQAAVGALAEAGVDLDQKDPDGFTAVIFATLSGHYDMAALLIEKGAGVNTADASGRTPLYTAVDMNTFEYSFNRPNPKPTGEMNAVDLVKFLLSKGANVNARLTERVRAAKYDTAGNPNLTAGATPFLKAVSTSDVQLMKILLEAGADPFLRNAIHSNALMVAAGLNWRRLGGIGAEPDAIEALKIILERGVNIDSYNDLGQTAMHAAVMRGRGQVTGGDEDGPSTVESMNLIKFLIERGARLDLRDKAGRTPVDMALVTRNVEALAYFETLGAKPTPKATK